MEVVIFRIHFLVEVKEKVNKNRNGASSFYLVYPSY